MTVQEWLEPTLDVASWFFQRHFFFHSHFVFVIFFHFFPPNSLRTGKIHLSCIEKRIRLGRSMNGKNCHANKSHKFMDNFQLSSFRSSAILFSRIIDFWYLAFVSLHLNQSCVSQQQHHHQQQQQQHNALFY